MNRRKFLHLSALTAPLLSAKKSFAGGWERTTKPIVISTWDSGMAVNAEASKILAANGRALAAGEAQGFIKVVADAKTDRLLGMHVVSAGAGDIVHEGMIAMEFVSSIEDLQLMTFAHPTISEAVHEAVLSADGRAIHAIQRKRK